MGFGFRTLKFCCIWFGRDFEDQKGNQHADSELFSKKQNL